MDILQREGKYPMPPGAPTILGVEFSGTVVEAGEGVTEWREGDEVLGLAMGVSTIPSRSHTTSTDRAHPSHRPGTLLRRA